MTTVRVKLIRFIEPTVLFFYNILNINTGKRVFQNRKVIQISKKAYIKKFKFVLLSVDSKLKLFKL